MDKIADLLIRIKNGYMASKKEVEAPKSKVIVAICQLLKDEGYVSAYKVEERNVLISLKYENHKPALQNVSRISKPGRRVYKGSKVLPRVLDGLGIAIISTPQGLMTDREARKKRVGGEIMAYVW